MTDDEIIKMIQGAIEFTDFKIISFNRNHEFFGNRNLIIENSKQRLEYITDRDDILSNSKLVFNNGYHVAGEDDCPLFLIKAIMEDISKIYYFS